MMAQDSQVIAHSSPDIGEEEIAALVACARSQQVKGGAQVRALEQRVAGHLGYAGAIATTTGSQAIHLALRTLFPRGKGVIGLPSYVCRSVYDAICLAGCQPLLVDIDPAHLSVSLDAARAARLDAVIVPHMFGIRAPIEAFLGAGLLVIEDCAQRLAPLDVANSEPKAPVRILSFEATKLLTCAEGGLALFDDPSLMARAAKLRDAPYDFAEPAVTLPLTDLQAAMGLVQWRRLPEFLTKRQVLADYYLRRFNNGCSRYVMPAMRLCDTYHFRFLLSVDDPEAFLRAGSERGLMFRQPVAPLPLHRLFGVAGNFAATDQAFARLVSIPLYPKLSTAAAKRVADVIKQALCCGEGTDAATE